LLAPSREESAAPPGAGNEAEGKAALWQAMRCKCGELSALVLRADDPEEAAAFVLGYLPKHFKYVLEPAQASTPGERRAP
jgi:hypothetical protein